MDFSYKKTPEVRIRQKMDFKFEAEESLQLISTFYIVIRTVKVWIFQVKRD